MANHAVRQHLYGMGVTALGTLVLSFESVLVRLAHTSGWNVAFWRGIWIILSLGALISYHYGPSALAVLRRREAQWIAVCFGLSGFFFILSLSLTKAANTTVLASSVPIFAAVFSWWWLKERIALRTGLAIVAAFAGIALVFAGSLGSINLLGDVCGVLPAVCLGAAFTLLRRYPDLPRMQLVWGGGVVTALLALPLSDPFTLQPLGYLAVAVQGALVLPIAMLLMSVGTRYISSAEVGLFLLIEAILGPVWVWLAVAEVPPPLTFVGGGIIVCTLVLHTYCGVRALRAAPHS